VRRTPVLQLDERFLIKLESLQVTGSFKARGAFNHILVVVQQQFITIDPPFNPEMSIEYVAMIVLGGMGTVFGAVAGALAFAFLSPLAQVVGRQLPLVSALSSAQQSILLFAVIVSAFLLFEPLGLFGIWLRIKRYFAAWPFTY